MNDGAPPGCTWEYRDDDADVLFVTNMWPDEERPVYGIFVQRQIESLRRTGVRCDVLYVRGYEGFHIYVRSSLWFLLNRRRLKERYRLLHAHAGETALVTSTLIGVPKIASYCGDDVLGQARPDGTFSRAALFRRRLIQQSARFCTRTITKSQEMAEVLPSPTRKHNRVVPNGINAEQFRPIDRGDARDALGWEQAEHIVVFVATRPHEPRKRLDLAQEAIAEAERGLGPIRLAVAENVAPSDLPLMMNAADCLLLTSRMEGSPNAVKEALMCNLPVITTAVGDVVELLEGVSHSSVCRDTPAELGAAVATVLRAGARSNGREMRPSLRQAAIAERILNIYREAGYESARTSDEHSTAGGD